MTENENKDVQANAAGNETAKQPEEKTKSKRGLLQTVIIVILAVAIGIGVPKLFKKEDIGFDKELLETANMINKNLPQHVDSETVLSAVAALPGKNFYYMYTLINFTKDQIDAEVMGQGLKKNILNGIKTSANMKNFRDNKVTMMYSYRDKNGEEIIMLEFPPEEYLK